MKITLGLVGHYPKLLLLVALAFTSCRSPANQDKSSSPDSVTRQSVLELPAPQSSVDIAVLIKSLSNPYWKSVYDGLVDTSAALNRSIFIQGLTAEDQAELQLNQCENAVLKQPKLMHHSLVPSLIGAWYQ